VNFYYKKKVLINHKVKMINVNVFRLSLRYVLYFVAWKFRRFYKLSMCLYRQGNRIVDIV